MKVWLAYYVFQTSAEDRSLFGAYSTEEIARAACVDDYQRTRPDGDCALPAWAVDYEDDETRMVARRSPRSKTIEAEYIIEAWEVEDKLPDGWLSFDVFIGRAVPKAAP